MPELPEVETVRRALAETIRGRTVQRVQLSGAALRGERVPASAARRLAGRRIDTLRRHGKYLLIDCDGGVSVLSHLGMSGRWLYFAEPPAPRSMPHVHVRLAFGDGSAAWYQDPRRFGIFRVVETAHAFEDPSLAALGPDPVIGGIDGTQLHAAARGARTPVKAFLLDQSRVAGIGNIYASEILHRAGVDPRRLAGTLGAAAWSRIAEESRAVLGEAIDRMGTTFSMYRTVWGEDGQYGEQLRVYGRVGEPCVRCGRAIRRIVQAGRSTYWCTRCQPAGRASGTVVRARPAR